LSPAGVVTFAAALAVVLGLIRLGRPSLWIDETFTARAVRNPVSDLPSELHILYYLLVKPWAAIAGTSEWALRFPSVVATAMAVAALYFLGRRVFDATTGALAALLLATNPFVVVWSHQARSYTLVIAVAIVATILLLRARDEPTPWRLLAYSAALLVALILHAFSAFLLLIPHAYLVATSPARRRLSLAVCSALAASTPWVLVVASRDSEGGPTSWLAKPSLLEVLGTVAIVPGVLGVSAVLAVIGVWLVRRESQARALFLLIWAFGPIVASYVLSAVKPVFLDRYLIVVTPAFALLAAVTLIRARPIGRLIAVGALTFVGSLQLIGFLDQPGSANWLGQDWKAAIQTAQAGRDASQRIVAAPSWTSSALDYYAPDLSVARPADDSIVYVLAWGQDSATRIGWARTTLADERYVILDEQPFGNWVALQRWRMRTS